MVAFSIHVHFNFIAEWNYFPHSSSFLFRQIFFLVCLKVEINLINCHYLKPNPIADFLGFFSLNFWRTSVLFVGPLIPLFWTSGNLYPWFGLLVTSALAFKARVDPLACVLHHLHATESSGSPLVRYQLCRLGFL